MSEQLSRELLIPLRDAAESIARMGGDATLDYFRKDLDPEIKEDDSPVTEADRKAEAIIRESIRNQFPDHGIIGEEFGSEGEHRDIVWVVDPIDGTKSFIHGIPLYTTLIAVMVEGDPVIGVIYAPVLEEMMTAAIGEGTHLNGSLCHVRVCNDLADATFLTTDIVHIRQQGFEEPYEKLLSEVRLHRTWGDAYGHLMVAAGRADLMFDPVLKVWDAAPLLPVIREAGGWYSDVEGNRTIGTGSAISCSAGIGQQVLEIFHSGK